VILFILSLLEIRTTDFHVFDHADMFIMAPKGNYYQYCSFDSFKWMLYHNQIRFIQNKIHKNIFESEIFLYLRFIYLEQHV